MDDFIKAASNFSYSMSNTAEIFYNGITKDKITPAMKVSIAYMKLLEYDKKIEQTNEIPQNVLDAIGGTTGETATTVKISDYDEVYKNFFIEKFQYDSEEGGCPYPRIVDETTGKIYLFHRCGGSGPLGVHLQKNISYEFDGNYYYVNQAVIFKKNTDITDTKNDKVVWKYDKNLYFVSTTIE